jgi:UDP-N-acetylmuramate--alanine ligase
MAPLAEVLSGMGLVITGSDISDSDQVKHLRSMGMEINIGHRAENITPETEFVVRTAAVHDSNPEIEEAHRRGIPVFERAEAWGAIMRDYENALCIAGTHGKTTTTSMCTHIMMAAERDPTVMIGGTLPLLESSGYRWARATPSFLSPASITIRFSAFSPPWR